MSAPNLTPGQGVATSSTRGRFPRFSCKPCVFVSFPTRQLLCECHRWLEIFFVTPVAHTGVLADRSTCIRGACSFGSGSGWNHDSALDRYVGLAGASRHPHLASAYTHNIGQTRYSRSSACNALIPERRLSVTLLLSHEVACVIAGRWTRWLPNTSTRRPTNIFARSCTIPTRHPP